MSGPLLVVMLESSLRSAPANTKELSLPEALCCSTGGFLRGSAPAGEAPAALDISLAAVTIFSRFETLATGGAGANVMFPFWLFKITSAAPVPRRPRKLRTPIRCTDVSGTVERTVPCDDRIDTRASSLDGIR